MACTACSRPHCPSAECWAALRLTGKDRGCKCTHPATPSTLTHPLPTTPSLPLPCCAAKGKILGQLAEVDKNLVDGSDEFLQLLGAASYAQRVLTGAA